jgi:hypothetical protein
MPSACSVMTLSFFAHSVKLFMNVQNCVPQTSTEEYFSFRTHCLLNLNYPLIILYYHNSIHCHSTRRDKGGEQLYVIISQMFSGDTPT